MQTYLLVICRFSAQQPLQIKKYQKVFFKRLGTAFAILVIKSKALVFLTYLP